MGRAKQIEQAMLLKGILNSIQNLTAPDQKIYIRLGFEGALNPMPIFYFNF